MRITDKMIRDRVLGNIQSSIAKIAKLHDQISSGVMVRYPSDNAVVATRAAKIQSRLREIEQYKGNVDYAQNILNSYDTSLQEVSSVYQRLRELLVQAANGVLTADQRQVIKDEIKEIKAHLIQIANTQVGTDYVFAGYESDKAPVDDDGDIVMDPNASKPRFINALGYKIEYGLTVNDIFMTKTGVSVFKLIDMSLGALESNDQAMLLKASLLSLDSLEDSVAKSLARVGGTQRMVEMVSLRIEDLNNFMNEYISKEVDTDLPKTLMELSTNQAALTAALKSAANILTATLVDFVE
ncbi:flagellar hook-associated protein FlgL [Pseudothermotoga sp. U03pept]|uniref:flagellar hook-associated protein FlgL n=1 Tax=Pseudothermotoga sp. U03pept TaxID=3447012 RepID=UPI003F0FD145